MQMREQDEGVESAPVEGSAGNKDFDYVSIE